MPCGRVCPASVAVFSPLLATGLVTAAGAAVYTVTLTNGSTFDTRYQPQRASWDADKIVLLNEFGNQISLHVSEVESVTVDTETRGFGSQLDDTTMALGWAPNDLPRSGLRGGEGRLRRAGRRRRPRDR